jgi:hypothetical protein
MQTCRGLPLLLLDNKTSSTSIFLSIQKTPTSALLILLEIYQKEKDAFNKNLGYLPALKLL